MHTCIDCLLRLHFLYRFSVKRMILAGIWFGPKKPSMPTFLEPFRTQMNALKETGNKIPIHSIMRIYYSLELCVFICSHRGEMTSSGGIK